MALRRTPEARQARLSADKVENVQGSRRLPDPRRFAVAVRHAMAMLHPADTPPFEAPLARAGRGFDLVCHNIFLMIDSHTLRE